MDISYPEIIPSDIAWHRNGISGIGFHVVRFAFTEDGDTHPDMLALVFPEPGAIAVLDQTALAQGVIAFGVNSWRGDRFEPAVRRAITEWTETPNNGRASATRDTQHTP